MNRLRPGALTPGRTLSPPPRAAYTRSPSPTGARVTALGPLITSNFLMLRLLNAALLYTPLRIGPST
jgi:hypothetical protein